MEKVTITDIEMPFILMVIFMVKWAVASIPAAIILMIGVSVVSGFIMGY